MKTRHLFAAMVAVVCSAGLGFAEEEAKEPAAAKKISYYDQIRPIFQASCQGCHQPAKAGGAYVMTAFDKMVAGGESESAAITPGKPDESYLVELITPSDGEAEMPKGKKPLAESDIELIRKWIEEGAEDDTPDNARARYDMDNPPVYTLPPVITSIDYSPDGQLLAVAGFHEVLLHKSDGSGLVARLVGVSERIESVAFAPDGNRIAVTGGLPGRMGELQIWKLEIPEEGIDNLKPSLERSRTVTYDTLYGGKWSPDGKLLAFGCGDNTVRAIDAESGEQVLFQGAHNDWVRDTVFTNDNKHLISVGRDMSVKLTEVETERFVDNITSITPGALKGGVSTVTRHPERDEIVIGGADGIPKVYRVFRETARRIGDDANRIRQFPAMKGRVFSVAVSPDGKRIGAGSSLDGAGEVSIYTYEFDTTTPEDIKKINSKTVQGRNADEKKRLEDYWREGAERLAQIDVPAGVFAVAFHPDNKTLAAAGADGTIRLISVESGKIEKSFEPAPIGSEAEAAASQIAAAKPREEEPVPTESLPEGAKVKSLEVQPEKLHLTNEFAYAQLLLTAVLESGDRIDVTRIAERSLSADIATISARGIVAPKADGDGVLNIKLGEHSASVPVLVSNFDEPVNPDFIRDVNPVISKLGCNAGTCHGARQGKNGFQLSLRGYDAIMDVRAFTDDLASRRANIASPDDSLMLFKATNAVPHVGGQLVRPGEKYYRIIRDWIGSGAKLDREASRVTSISVLPENPVVQTIGARQQVRVVATYADGTMRDVTKEAYVTSGNTEIATADDAGLMTSLRRGEAPVLVRYEGAYAATTLTVMGNREGFEFKETPAWGEIDKLTAAKWQRMKILPSELCTDAEFIRRAYLDLTGLPPTSSEVQRFLNDKRDTRAKRADLVDTLVGSDEYVTYWTNKWADLLQVNRKFLGVEGAAAFRKWIRLQISDNVPYDQFATKVITASGSNRDNPAASYFKILRTPVDTMENTTHLFLGVRFNCNKCHDHPFERWTQDQYYETAAYFARFNLQRDPKSGDKRIGGTAVEGAKPLYEIVSDKDEGEVVHDRTKEVTAPAFPYECSFESPGDEASRREQLAAWMTSPDNEYFAKSYVNRLWGYLFGVGIIEPIDDIRAGNPPSNPELLDYLTKEFIDSDFNVRHVIRLITKSRTYQLSVAVNKYNEDDDINYSHAVARRLPAEVLYDAIQRVTGATSKFPGVPPGTRAAALPDVGVKLPSGFLTTLGRPARESACECERVSELQLGPVMALVSGPTVGDAIGDPANELAKLVATETDDRKLINELFLRVLNRPAEGAEIDDVIAAMNSIEKDHEGLSKTLAEREEFWKKREPELQKAREEAIAKAKGELEAFEKEIADKVAKLEKEREERIKKAEGELKAYEDKLPEHLANWAKDKSKDVEWLPLEPKSLSASNKAKLTRLADRSIRAEGNANKGAYVVTVHTKLRGINGIRVEALPVEGLKGGGPGLPENGNFVLTEFEVKAAPLSEADKLKKVALHKAVADFEQDGKFKAGQAIDGKPGDQNGWAVSPAGGVVHWITFEAKDTIDHEGGSVLQFVLHQNHNAKDHRLARFRISVTTEKDFGLSLPESLKAIVATDAKQRTEAQNKLFTSYFRKVDGGFKEKNQAIAEAKKPVPEDPGVTSRKKKLEYVSREVRLDSLLAQLRKDHEMSTKQLENKRLTAAQDLAWALINSPAFLFNH